MAEIDHNNERGTLHPSTYQACENVDAAMFTGDPGETEAKFLLLKYYVDRWQKRLEEVGKDPWFKRESTCEQLPSQLRPRP